MSDTSEITRSRGSATALLLAMEACVLFMVVVAPWLLGANDPWAYSILGWPLGIGLMCWAILAVHTGKMNICLCPIGLCLVGLILVTLGQLVPLPKDIVQLISPATASLRLQMVPAQAELIAEGAEVAMPLSWQSLSLDPAATRVFLTQITAITLLYLMVRSNLARQVLLLRLGWVLLFNGAALAFFAIAQSITSATNDVVYWTWITPGAVFGPFVCRNHYPDYINLCIGTVLGVIGWTYYQKMAPRSRDGFLKKAEFWRPIQELLASPLELINKPATLLCVFAIALMMATIPMSMSRGGSLALVSSMIFTAIAWVSAGKSRAKKSKGSSGFEARNLVLALWLALPVFGLVAWFGWDVIGKRLGTITEKATLQEDRVNVWLPLLDLVQQYPLTGTGAGTLGVVEPIVRKIGGYPGVVLDHAHNEYLEAMVEGGVVRLAITLLMVFWLVRMGMRGIRRHRGEPSALMPVGLLFGLLALAIHSTVDFGVHMASVAVLATVCLAHLSALSRRQTTDRLEAQDHEETSVWVLDGMVARLGGCLLAIWALLLVNDLATGSTVFRLQMEADQQPFTNAGQERRIQLLESAARLRPWMPEIHETIGLAALDMVSSQDTTNRAFKREVQQIADTDLILDVLGGPLRYSPFGLFAGQLLIEKDRSSQPDVQWANKYWEEGLAELARCRALSPIYRRSHAYMGLFADRFEKSEPASVHLYRSALVYSFDPDLWYSAGVASWMEGDKATGPNASKVRAEDQGRAAVLWRNSLRRSTAHLPDILSRSLEGEEPAKLLEKLLTDEPGVLLEAIRLHKPSDRKTDPRPGLLEAARQQLVEQAAGASAANWRALSELQQKLGEPEGKVLNSLRKAVSLTPTSQKAAIGLELARRLEENGLIDEAQRLVDQVIQVDSENKLAKEMQRVLRRNQELAPYLDPPKVD